MKPPPPKPSGRPATSAPGDTQVIDLQDVELVMGARQMHAEHERSLPPPLPPEVRASHVPMPAQASQPPGPYAPSFQPAPPAPPRSTVFYVVALLVFLLVGVGGGLAVAMTFRKPPSAAPTTPIAHPQAAVITIPTVEVDDDPDGGK